MAKRRRVLKQDEVLSRTVEIRSFRASVRLGIEDSKRPDPEIESKPWLELMGTLGEPVRDVREIRISLYPETKPTPGPARPPAVGAIIQTRPEVSVVASLPHADFDRVWAMALAGQLRHAFVAFTKPRYRTALVLSLSVSNVVEE